MVVLDATLGSLNDCEWSWTEMPLLGTAHHAIIVLLQPAFSLPPSVPYLYVYGSLHSQGTTYTS